MEIPAKYLVFGREVGANGTKHLQGYVKFTKRMTFVAAKELLGSRIHLEARRGSEKQAADYCKKDGDFFEKGQISSQGKRTDITTIKQKIAAGTRMCELGDDIKSYQHLKFAEGWMKHFEPKRVCLEKPLIRWFWGETGTGKTRKALEEMPDAWISSKTLRWWDGYDAHEEVIFDDFRKDFCTFHELLRLLDRYPMRVEFKGGSRQLRAKKIIITSCHHPKDVYDTREDVEQLLRRIDEVRHFSSEFSL